jgi:hypothetical protein
MTPREYFADYKSNKKIIEYFENIGIADKEFPEEEYTCLFNKFLWASKEKVKQYVCDKVLPAIKKAKKEKRTRYFLVFQGLDGYLTMVFNKSRKSCYNRGGRHLKYMEGEIIDTFEEYSWFTGNPIETLTVRALTEDELLETKLFPFLKKPVHTVAINLPDSFFQRFNLNN